MGRFELGMSINYAKNWGVTEAVREFFQNALDEEKENPENKMLFKYEESEDTLYISNKKSRLSPKSLLLGSTSKQGKEELIGEHGEGYKVATVVLVRNGVTVEIFNNEAKEVWTSKIVRSRRYDADIVVFDVKKQVFKSDYDLVVKLKGITSEMYSEIINSNLHLQEDIGEVKEASEGRLLLNPKYKGHIYVEGLFVCKKDFLSWGYDLNAGLVKLDRDRGLIDSFDLQWTLGKLLSTVNDEQFLADHVESSDMQYIHYFLPQSESLSKRVSDRVYSSFKEEHGVDAIPVHDTDDFNQYANSGAKPVMVSAQKARIINLEKRNYPIIEEIGDIEENFNLWVLKAKTYLPTSLVDEIKELWKNK